MLDEASTRLPNEQRARLQRLYDDMQQESLYPLWEVLSDLVTPLPASPAISAKWSLARVRDYLMRAGDLITAAQAQRRVLVLENPGLPGSSAATSSLYAGLQLILPGEVAPCHRHSQSALRFVLEGSGAFTAVDGEKAMMNPYDLVLTPNGQWHDHGNTSDRPMIWLDGLDVPLVRTLDASFTEHFAEESHPETVPNGDSLLRYGRNMRPMRGSTADRRPATLPLFHYPYAQWRLSLEKLADADSPDPRFGHALEFLNPADGGPIMATLSAHVRLLPAGFETLERRSTDGSIFVVVEGQGHALVESVEHALVPGDIFVVPSWRRLTLRATTELVLFAYSDRAAQEKLGLYKESA